MSGGRVGVGVIGAGVISNQYLENLTVFPDLDVRFVADIDLERAKTQADKYGVPGSGTVEELLADDDIEIVVNLTIPKVHVEVALQALAAGKNVWSEKPFALDRASGRELLEAAHAAGLRVATAPDTFLGSGIQSARRLIENGDIGAPLTALTLMQSPGPESWHPNPDFLFQEGAGPLFDIGPYYLTALVQIFGPVARVSASASRARETRVIGSGPRAGEEFAVTVPTHVSALYEFESGQTAQAVFSFDSKLGRTQFEVAGVDGTLVVPDPNTFEGELLVHGGDGIETVPSTGTTDSRGIGVVELARAIRAGVPERASGEQAYHVLDIMVSTIEAGESRTPVEVESTVDVAPALPEDWDPRAATLA
ncbi:Predicted dehydrogenase [Leifsonia sp. 98AMF]|uniref:Gfo/Idh/MocA family protein n=1 Tax=unclassified Leifsonia TaxID=2663824 RepID=UPI00087A6739|nr:MULTISPECIES: Gfo/Idh/MocA family oxidoreductase [unclassified Leifsonia]SDH12130.1 Predicted dehydrogenase [Leifsonia sp. 197AMF]SDJ26579.1 Predicted dehydrogenase [Leifsonia sp. 466MF]SDK55405.1 Predicted dehydrogenase [Leifsonia sp. 157MF]SDN48568.1 Predicted dehydrogenase [Leifsonia sp. 509MF]SEN62126.1 Predicted dehydrogenase [Leifsonia sp. 467MF]